MSGERHVAAGEVGLAGGRLEGRRRRPFGDIDEPELGVGTKALVQRGGAVTLLGGEEVAGALPSSDEALVGARGDLEQIDQHHRAAAPVHRSSLRLLLPHVRSVSRAPQTLTASQSTSQAQDKTDTGCRRAGPEGASGYCAVASTLAGSAGQDRLKRRRWSLGLALGDRGVGGGP